MSKQVQKLDAEIKNLGNLLKSLRKIINLDDAEDLQTDLFTCFNHAGNEHLSELNEIAHSISELLSCRVDKVNKLELEQLNK